MQGHGQRQRVGWGRMGSSISGILTAYVLRIGRQEQKRGCCNA